MATPKTLVVFGASGNQGGSVIDTILRDAEYAKQWNIKAVTRDVTKPSAKALQEKGVEVITADFEDKASLKKALEGAYAVFLVTNYWEKMSADAEKRQGMNVADVAKEVGVQHLIFSSLLNISKISNGVFKNVYHFDSKADIEEYIRSLSIPATFFMAGVYMSNFAPQKMFRPSPEPPHAYTMALPSPTDQRIVPLVHAEVDTGKFVKGILKHRDTLLGKRIYAATDYYSPDDMAAALRRVKPQDGRGATVVQVSPEQFRAALGAAGMPEFVQLEMSENFEMLAQCGYFGREELDESQAILDEPLTTWEQYIQTDKAFADLK